MRLRWRASGIALIFGPGSSCGDVHLLVCPREATYDVSANAVDAQAAGVEASDFVCAARGTFVCAVDGGSQPSGKEVMRFCSGGGI